jgi:hypothetical protein
MSSLLDRCLADLERRIDDRQEEGNAAAWIGFVENRCTDGFFSPPARSARPPEVNWPDVNLNDAIADYDAMLLQQFGACSAVLAQGGGARLCVRCNYGTGILPLLFGCELFVMDRQTNTLPTTKPLASVDWIRALLDAGVPEIRGGLVDKVFESARRFLDAMARYPAIGRHVTLYHPDAQGPIDLAELIWGSDIFYAFYDDPDLLNGLLKLVTNTYAAFMRKWFEVVPPSGPVSVHWGLTHKGRLMIRNDSMMNLSAQTYAQFIRRHDQKLLDMFGGGAIHFCGRGDHYIEELSKLRGLTGINLSQPHLNDMEVIYHHTVDKGIKILGLDADWARKATRPLRGQVATA